jgi:hypothetical protein
MSARSHGANFKMFKFLATSVLVLGVFVGASAHAATKSEEDACEKDVMRLCRKLIDQGDFTILTCLKEKRTRISRACDKVLKSHGQ